MSSIREKRSLLNWWHSPALLLTVALIAGIGLRSWHLARTPLSFDEAANVHIARMPFDSVLQKNGAFNSSPPAMLLLLHFALKLGDSEELVRAISVLAGIATIYLVYQIGKQLTQMRLCGALAALLFALSSQQVLLSRQFRVYALGELFGALGLLAALAFVRQPNWRSASLAGFSFFLGMQVQYALAPFFATVGVALACRRPEISAPWRVRLGHLALIALAAVLGLIVVYETALKYQMYSGRGTSYASTLFSSSPSGLDAIILFIVNSGRLIASGLNLESIPWSGGVLSVFCAIGAWILARRNLRDPYLLAALCAMPAFGLLSVANYYPYGPVRQCLIVTLPLYALTAIGILGAISSTSKFWRVVALTMLAVLPVGFLAGLAGYAQPGQTTGPAGRKVDEVAGDFRVGMRAIESAWKPGDVIFVPPGSYPLFEYYSKRFTARPWIVAKGSLEWMQDERAWSPMLGGEPPYASQLDALMCSSKRIWMPYSHYHPREMSFLELAARRQWLDQVETIMSAGGLEAGEGNELYLYRRRDDLGIRTPETAVLR